MILEFYILISAQLFAVGAFGLVSHQKHVLFSLIAIEILLVSVSLIFISCSVYFGDLNGQVFVLFILTIAAAESATGLSLLILFFKLRGTIEYPFINLVKA